jgi:hypothetical protein
MWVREHQQLVKDIKKEAVWALWKDINHWPTWHDDLEYCQLNGEFAVGNFFMLKPKNAPAVKIVITEMQEGKSFTDCTQFFGAQMIDTHSMEETSEGLLLKNKLVVQGPLKWLWIHLVARHVANTVPDETEALLNLARQKNV